MISVTRLRLAILTRWDGPQYTLGVRCAIDPATVCLYVTGKLAIPDHHRAILAHVLDLEPEDLVGWWDGQELWEKVAG